MMTTVDPQATFRQEAQDLLEQLEAALLDLEEMPDDRELIDSAFRALHTIKGSGAMFGFDAVAKFAHRIENAFDDVRKGKTVLTHELISIALSAKDYIRTLMESPEDGQAAVGEKILADLAVLVSMVPQAAAPQSGTTQSGTTQSGSTQSGAVSPSATGQVQTFRIRYYLPGDSMSLGTNPLLLLNELRSLGACTVVALGDAIPPLEEIDPAHCYLGWNVLLTTDQPRSAIDEVFIFVLDDMTLSIDAVEVDADEPKRIGEILVEQGLPQDVVDTALTQQRPLGQILVKTGDVSPDQLAAALAEQTHLREKAEPSKTAQAKSETSIRVPAERLDDLMDQVGELVITQARFRQLASAIGDVRLKALAEEVERLASGLRDTTMGIRMVPIGSLFGRFRRLVRDLSRDLGKEIQLTTSGEETELDKTVIERLNDPLVHLIRNSIDHGIEDREGRLAAGKSEQGLIHLSAIHSGAQVLISIKDDGRGLDRVKIRARAEEQGLLAPDAKISDADLLEFIFHPGFSTARSVTSVSGRGVGMDVVHRTIEALRGAIEVSSVYGKGSEVVLRLPLTLAIIDGLLVRVGGNRYVIPLSAIEECVELSDAEANRQTGRNFLSIRGDLVPFLKLRDLFNAKTPADQHPKVVIVSDEDRRVGLVVDQVIGDHQTVIKSLSKLHADVQSFSGATILGDGTVALILDIAHLIAFGQAEEQRRQAS